MDADLELAAEPDVTIGKGEGGTTAGTGEEAFHLGEGLDLFLSRLADFARGSALVISLNSATTNQTDRLLLIRRIQKKT